MSECGCTDMSLDMKTPRNAYLSAFYKRSFAYHTVRNRLPVIITQLIDNLYRKKQEIVSQYGEESAEELKTVIGGLSKFKYEILTNKPLAKLSDVIPDAKIYNDYIDSRADSEEGQTTHFNTVWLLTENYMYTRIKEIFASTKTLANFDYFQSSKIEQFAACKELRVNLAKYVAKIEENINNFDIKTEVLEMLKLNLWGNKCDLSISLGKVSGPGDLHDLEELQPFVLCDDSEQIYKCLTDPNEKSEIVDIVLDNAGYELFTDFCLMDILTLFKLTSKVRFHVKAIPWFVSDVMLGDFRWTIEQLCQSEDVNLKSLGSRWRELIENGTWSVVEHRFWTLPFEFKFMEEKDPALYESLSEAKLIIFKGDLNYRKLFGETNWDPAMPPRPALQGFLPSNLCTLRTIKAHIVVGIKPGVAEEIDQKDEKWMEKGDYGLIQFIGKTEE